MSFAIPIVLIVANVTMFVLTLVSHKNLLDMLFFNLWFVFEFVASLFCFEWFG